MPQMAPYNWLNLFLMFSLIFMIFVSYFNFIKTFKNNKKISKYQLNNFKWKW